MTFKGKVFGGILNDLLGRKQGVWSITGSLCLLQVANSVREQGEVNPGSNDEQVSHYCKWCKFLLSVQGESSRGSDWSLWDSSATENCFKEKGQSVIKRTCLLVNKGWQSHGGASVEEREPEDSNSKPIPPLPEEQHEWRTQEKSLTTPGPWS